MTIIIIIIIIVRKRVFGIPSKGFLIQFWSMGFLFLKNRKREFSQKTFVANCKNFKSSPSLRLHARLTYIILEICVVREGGCVGNMK
jgi:hypothetical protein